jgi:hypothetical protein
MEEKVGLTVKKCNHIDTVEAKSQVIDKLPMEEFMYKTSNYYKKSVSNLEKLRNEIKREDYTINEAFFKALEDTAFFPNINQTFIGQMNLDNSRYVIFVIRSEAAFQSKEVKMITNKFEINVHNGEGTILKAKRVVETYFKQTSEDSPMQDLQKDSTSYDIVINTLEEDLSLEEGNKLWEDIKSGVSLEDTVKKEEDQDKLTKDLKVATLNWSRFCDNCFVN